MPLIPDGAQLVANGKQALSLVAQDLRDRGVRTLLAPDFYCLTMIQPFQLEGLTIHHIATDSRALMNAQALEQALTTDRPQAVLHCEVFGARAEAPLRAVLDEARIAGARVVVDATHSLLAGVHDPADYLIASLRKLLPLPDGAFVAGPVRGAIGHRRELDEQATRLGLEAVRLREDFLDGRGAAMEYLQAVDAAEDAMLEAREAVDMSPVARRGLEAFDAKSARELRSANAHRLISRLDAQGFEVRNRATAECGVAVCVDDEQAVEGALLAEGIICPISWPRPPGLGRAQPWHTGWVTLPVDPQMPGELLDRAATIVERHLPASVAGPHPR